MFNFYLFGLYLKNNKDLTNNQFADLTKSGMEYHSEPSHFMQVMIYHDSDCCRKFQATDLAPDGYFIAWVGSLNITVYAFPGNVRELENEIERAITIALTT
jgi:hypothetical protein